jgi:hypothetical protein
MYMDMDSFSRAFCQNVSAGMVLLEMLARAARRNRHAARNAMRAAAKIWPHELEPAKVTKQRGIATTRP